METLGERVIAKPTVFSTPESNLCSSSSVAANGLNRFGKPCQHCGIAFAGERDQKAFSKISKDHVAGGILAHHLLQLRVSHNLHYGMRVHVDDQGATGEQFHIYVVRKLVADYQTVVAQN